MRSIRLLPVVIFAALALLVFKGIGLVTNGGYVLTGPAAVMAADGDTPSADVTVATPSEATMADTSPTMDDSQPTLATKVDAPPPVASSREAAAASSAASSAAADASASSSASASAAATAEACPPKGARAAAEASAAAAGQPGAKAPDCQGPPTPVNAHGDALPTVRTATGVVEPLSTLEGDNSEQALLARLGDRRAELDKREADLAMRESLVRAAEKKLDERTRELAALQQQVASLVDQKQASEAANFKAIVSMYETMRPKDAAKIFDTLDLNVLIKVAQAMNPRKMSPILAAMSATPAQALTTALATTGDTDTVAQVAGGQDLSALPQIVGH
ncbi:MAG: MotE family protein [Devosia sp.]